MGESKRNTANLSDPEQQMPLWADGIGAAESATYLSRQLITYIGNKRALIGPILQAVASVRAALGGRPLRVFDAFSGSGAVSRALKSHCSLIISNDLEDYAAVVARCYLANRGQVDIEGLARAVSEINFRVEKELLPPGFIEELYAPRDEHDITPADRVFYTPRNARRLDNYRRLIGDAPAHFKDLLLGPLLSSASIHANTAGVFKGFYKDGGGKGHFGGRGADALARITGEIVLETPVLSNFCCSVKVIQGDANEVAPTLPEVDLAYIDPPYNQHPYGSNYFMLNLLVNYRRPLQVSKVSGIPHDWRRSGYNVRGRAPGLLRSLLSSINARFLLISYNNEGFVGPREMRALLACLGKVNSLNVPYTAFRGSRNFNHRPVNVTEHLFLVDRG